MSPHDIDVYLDERRLIFSFILFRIVLFVLLGLLPTWLRWLQSEVLLHFWLLVGNLLRMKKWPSFLIH